MAAKNFSVSQNEHGTYHLRGELSIHDLDDLKGFLEESRKGEQEIVISLADVRFIDTAALQLLIAFKKRFEPEGMFRISAVSSEVEKILSLCGLKATLV
jgi:anti-anti-sigma factor